MLPLPSKSIKSAMHILFVTIIIDLFAKEKYSEYSYVTCNFTIINKGEADFESTLNNLVLHFGANAGYTEARAYNSNKKDKFKKDYFYITLKPDTEYNFNIAYVVKDDVLDEFKSDMLIFISFVEPTPGATYPVIEKQ